MTIWNEYLVFPQRTKENLDVRDVTAAKLGFITTKDEAQTFAERDEANREESSNTRYEHHQVVDFMCSQEVKFNLSFLVISFHICFLKCSAPEHRKASEAVLECHNVCSILLLVLQSNLWHQC